MNRYPPLWAVLAPGEPSWVKRRTFIALELEEGEEEEDGPSFEIIPGSGRYHAIVGLDGWGVGAELRIAEALSLECDEPVYSIECANDPWAVMSWQNGALEVQEVDPGDLAESLGCPLPGHAEFSNRPRKPPLRKVALVEGVRAHEAQRVLEEDRGKPLAPGRYRFEETQQGLLLANGTGELGYADITVSERFPHATVYTVIASPVLDPFFVAVRRGGEDREQFTRPMDEFPLVPEVSEIKGERLPERILAALGIPAQWFANE